MFPGLTDCFLRSCDSGIKHAKLKTCVNSPNYFCQKLITGLPEQHTSGIYYQNYVALNNYTYEWYLLPKLCSLEQLHIRVVYITKTM